MPFPPVDDGGPGNDPGSAVSAPTDRSALGRLVKDDELFARATWAREPRLWTAADGDAFTDLLSTASVDELLSQRGLRTPFLRVAKDGTTLSNATFTAPGGVGAGIGDQVSDDKLAALFAAGSTLVLQGLHRIWPPIIDFCQQLASDLGHPVQANAYVTPPQSRGFEDHYDVHDVFVLQVAGRKRWSIHAPVLSSPLRDQPWTDRRAAVRAEAEQEPVIDAVLEPGDVLYLPRGYLHSATALGGVTIHLTLGVHTWTRHAVAEEITAMALRDLADDPEARESLPLGTTLAGDEIAVELITEKLREALDALDPDEVAARLRGRRRGSQRAAPLGPLAQHALAATLTDATALRLRDHLAVELDRPDRPDGADGADGAGSVRLRSRAGTVVVDAVPGDVLKRLLAGDLLLVEDLGRDTALRLIEAGLVVAG